jgi:ribosomal protein S18 acetylase RimI-like enzyme
LTVVERNAQEAAGYHEYTVEPLHDRETIRVLLEARRPYAAYALGQLDPRLFRLTRWWRATGESGEQALVLHSRGGLGNATFAMGEAGALEALLRAHPGPLHTFFTCEVHHLDTVGRYFRLDQRQAMIRMQVTADTFRPINGEVRRLDGRDARQINSLYRTDGVPSFYTQGQIEDAVYFGGERDGRLVAIAGTHVISVNSGIAVVGNVYTHPRYRGKRLAQMTTSAVTEQLLKGCREVVLSVDPTNVAAVSAYERLGYMEVARLVEGAATRRDTIGFVTAARRMIARARGAGREIVRVRAG